MPIWIWVFFIIPGHLTYDLYLHGPDYRHAYWLAIVTAICAWRGWVGRLPGCEYKPYIIYWGEDAPNLGYRVVCYTAAWADLLIPYLLNVFGLIIAVTTGKWRMAELYQYAYYPLLALIVLSTVLNFTPRAKRSTLQEGAERAWFYVCIWTIVPAQTIGWAMWRLGPRLGFEGHSLDIARTISVLGTTAVILSLGIAGILPRTKRYYYRRDMEAATAAV